MRSVILLIAAFLVSFQLHAFPKAPFDALKTSISPDKNASEYDFEGIVKLSNCSGSLIIFPGQPITSKAHVLTNGHCLKTGFFGRMLRPGEVIVGQSMTRSMKVFDASMNTFSINATQISYGAMTKTDVGLYELSQTYEEIAQNYNVRPLELRASHPFIGEQIEVISGYWERGYSCHIDHFVFRLDEGGYTMNDSIRYSSPGCEVIGGTSGSPIINKDTREVIGINNTGNESGDQCTMNNPCEIDQDGAITVVKGRTYGQQTYLFYGCLNPAFQIQLDREGCELAKP